MLLELLVSDNADGFSVLFYDLTKGSQKMALNCRADFKTTVTTDVEAIHDLSAGSSCYTSRPGPSSQGSGE